MGKITTFPRAKRPTPDAGAHLTIVPSACHHERKILVDETLNEVECGDCHAKLNPMIVLRKFAHREARALETIKRAGEISTDLEKRMRTKCQHCKQMTRISR